MIAMMCLELEAAFAACRTFTAGSYRPTATFLAPSAAYGLILNLAGLDSRLREEDPRHGGKVPAKWSDITTVPRPTDPATGEGFDAFYQVKDGVGILNVPALPGEPASTGRHFELTSR